MRPVLLLLACASAVWGQEADPLVSRFGRRYDGFRQLFDEAGATVGSAAEFHADLAVGKANQWVVVALGPGPTGVVPAGGWEAFVRQGGRLLAATDAGSDEFRALGVSFLPGPLQAGNPADSRNRRQELPFIQPAIIDPLFEDVSLPVANLPGRLRRFGGAEALARFPLLVAANGDWRRDALAICRSKLGGGAAWFVADQSVFINEMFLDDRDEPLNAGLAANMVAELLRGRPPGQRRTLFIEDGVAIAQWIEPRYANGDWREDKVADAVDQARRWLRLADRATHQFETAVDDASGLPVGDAARARAEAVLPYGEAKRVAWAALLAVAAALGLGWLRRGSAPVPAPLSLRAPARSAAEERRRGILDSGNHTELARGLSRLALRRWLGAEPAANEATPPLPSTLGRTSRKLFAPTWNVAWRLARGDEAPAMSAADYRRFHSDLSRLQRLLTLPATPLAPERPA